MSVQLSKLNKAGLGNGTLGINRKSTGVSTQATRNLANSSVASKAQFFSFRGTLSANFVAGKNMAKNISKYDYTAIRAKNRPYTPPAAEFVPDYSTQNIVINNGNNSAIKGYTAGIITQATIGFLNQFGVFSGGSTGHVSAGSTLNNAMSTLGGNHSIGNSAETSSAISGMRGSSDSAGLRQAISGAEAQMESLSYVNSDSAIQDFNQAKQDVTKADSDVKSCQKEYDSAKEDVSRSEQSVKTLTTTRDTKKQALTNAMTKKNQCSTAFAQAHANTISAQKTLDNTPETIPDGNGGTKPNPAYQTAKQALEQAKEAENKAKTELDAANEAAVKADSAVQQAEKDLQAEQSKLDNAEKALDKNKEKLADAETKLNEAKQAKQDAQDKVDKYNSDKKDYETLKTEITSQKERLTKLEKQEQDEFNKLGNKIDEKSNKINERASKIDASDGMNATERLKQRRNEKDETELETMQNKKALLADNVAKTDILRSNSNIQRGTNGEELRTGNLPSGKAVYFNGTREISMEEFIVAGGQP